MVQEYVLTFLRPHIDGIYQNKHVKSLTLKSLRKTRSEGLLNTIRPLKQDLKIITALSVLIEDTVNKEFRRMTFEYEENESISPRGCFIFLKI
ncbi:UNVERIFIED_CONTAM: hypothetical protein NCL1_17076 [Trichonephila clavipes]